MTLVLHQARYDLLAFWRNRESRFFTVILPLVFMVIFVTVFGNDNVELGDGHLIKQSTYYVPNLMALAVISAALQNLVIAVVTQREAGILKRRRATPVPAWALIAGRALTVIAVAFANFALLALVGRVVYGVNVPGRTLPAMLVTVAVGAASFCCIGYAFASVLRSEESANPTLQATVLPLYFISGVFFPEDTVPGWMLGIADAFPVRHLAKALLTAYDPATAGAGFALGHLAIVAAWGAAGLAFAVRRFRWTPLSR